MPFFPFMERHDHEGQNGSLRIGWFLGGIHSLGVGRRVSERSREPVIGSGNASGQMSFLTDDHVVITQTGS